MGGGREGGGTGLLGKDDYHLTWGSEYLGKDDLLLFSYILYVSSLFLSFSFIFLILAPSEFSSFRG